MSIGTPGNITASQTFLVDLTLFLENEAIFIFSTLTCFIEKSPLSNLITI